MLGWVLRRGSEHPRGDVTAGDTTQLDQPDTPAPIFAARAFKSALFGTPARKDDDTIESDIMGEPRDSTEGDGPASKTPSKPAGILLTPGTGTSRRKRVSFGRDVVDKNQKPADDEADTKEDKPTQKRTKLTEALEKSRRSAVKSETIKADELPQRNDPLEDEWEEEDDDYCSHDITLDLNEPHSRSGRYWKSEFEQYHQDAKTEMAKLLKYKELAKSYAKMKDEEAVDLQEKLKEEQARVVKMERTVSEMKGHVEAKSTDKDDPEMKRSLAKQTALAEQYHDQVLELEALLQDQDLGSEVDSRNRKGKQIASPRTQKTLLETRRELRKARAQIKENAELREEVSKLKSDLLFAEQRATKLVEENKKLAAGATQEGSSTKDLRAQLREAREETRRKDEELRRLRDEYVAFREDAETHQDEAKRVLEKATDKISELKKEIKALKAGGADNGRREKAGAGGSSSSLEDSHDPKPESGGGGNSRTSDRTRALRRDARELARRSMDMADLAGRVASREADVDVPVSRPLSMDVKLAARSHAQPEDKPKDISPPASPLIAPKTSLPDILANRPNLERPRWQPYHPRSPRNRDYFTRDLSRRIFRGGAADEKANMMSRFDLPAMDAAAPGDGGGEGGQIDLLQSRFARLGTGRDLVADNSAVMNASARSNLPPERRAAAMARLEQRKAMRRREVEGDKENVKP